MLVLIGSFKLLKAALLITVAIGAHHLLHHDVQDVVRHWARAVRVDPDNRYLHAVLSKLTGVNDRTLRELSVGTFCYAAVFITEGIGLVLRKRWAEYFTVISTAALLPLEGYEIYLRVRLAKIVVLVFNLAIVGYLIWRLWRTRKTALSLGAAGFEPTTSTL